MSCDPVLTTCSDDACEEVLVVHEGTRRLRWHRASPRDWRLVGLWPDRHEITAVLERVRRGQPVFIVLPAHPDAVAVEEHEVALPLGSLTQVSADGGVLELAVPLLDWLPEPLRTRGLLFATQAAAAIAGDPAGLQPPLVVEQLSQSCPVRFARRTHVAVSDDDIAEVARYLHAADRGPDAVARPMVSAATSPDRKLGRVLHGAIDPDELAHVAVQLAGPRFRAVTATTVNVDTGVAF